MKFTREATEGRYSIYAFSHREVTLNALPGDPGQDEEGHLTLRQSFIVMPTKLHRNWTISDIGELDEASLAPVSGQGMEVILIGTGRHLHFPSAKQLAALVSMGVGYEVMDSAAACRTYNILVSEGRQVAAAVIIQE